MADRRAERAEKEEDILIPELISLPKDLLIHAVVPHLSIKVCTLLFSSVKQSSLHDFVSAITIFLSFMFLSDEFLFRTWHRFLARASFSTDCSPKKSAFGSPSLGTWWLPSLFRFLLCPLYTTLPAFFPPLPLLLFFLLLALFLVRRLFLPPFIRKPCELGSLMCLPSVYPQS